MSVASPVDVIAQNKSRTASRITARRAWFQIALLVVSTGVLYAAVTVVAAREPDSQDAYAPPPAPGAFKIEPAQPQDTNVVAPAAFVSADPSLAVAVPVVGTEVVAAPADEADAAFSAEDETAPEVTPAATSSAVQSPEVVASSWSMDPLPEEGKDGTAGSSTSMDPVTPTSSMVASPQ